MMQKHKFRKKFVVIGVILLALVAAVWGSTQMKPSTPTKEDVRLVPVKIGAIHQVVSATGKVVPNFEVEIKAKASGRIIRLPYDVSDSVRQGDLLVELDPIDESRSVSQAQASLASLQGRVEQNWLNVQVAERNLATDLAKARADLSAAQAKASEARAKAQRLASLLKDRYISQQEYEVGLSEIAQAEANLTNAQIRLQELQTQAVAIKAQAKGVSIAAAEAQAQRVALASSRQRLHETKIYAPISGVITSRAGQLGSIVSSGISNVGGGTAIMTLADLSRIFVLASVDESDIGQVKEGQQVFITADSYPGRQFSGKVVRISPKGLEEANVVTFEVKIEVEDKDKHMLKPEMTTNVEILIASRDKALTIPIEAVTSQDGQSVVRVPDADGKLMPRVVVTGIQDGNRVEILQGLSVGEKVALEQGQGRSRWRREGSGPSNGNRRGQMMMMRSMGRR
jgi:HlyD family secretion protein